MTHTNFNSAFGILETLALKEIKIAILAHEGECCFYSDPRIVLVGKFRYAENSEDIILTKITIENDNLIFYGIPAHRLTEEQVIEEISLSSYNYILDAIQPSPEVKGVRNIEEIFSTIDALRHSLIGLE